MGNTFFTSDMHIGHKLVSGLRGFHDPSDQDNALIKNWHNTVTEHDIVWLLGDMTCSNGQIDRMLGIVSRLPGTKHLIAGNHDPVHSMHKGAHKWQAKYLTAFASVQPFAKISVEGKPVLLSHFPYSADHTADARYSQFRLRDEGNFLIHGHTHSNQQVTSARELHVGLDAWNLRPVPLQIIERFVRGEYREGDAS